MQQKPKVIAFYLPQFHKVPENDVWWGEDFTDWIAAQNATPFFLGHNQPRIPANDYYYNLLDKKTLEWQAQLAKKAGIYGFCIYHYWFGEKQLLEKPAENLLKWKEINIHYCFSWANESWIPSWSGLKGNTWCSGTVTKKNYNAGYLVKQQYGSEQEWKKHFDYLLPFFEDSRYIKKDNKPVFIIYKPDDFKRLSHMIIYWNKLAKLHGMEGIYFIGTNCQNAQKRGMDAMVLYEPLYTLKHDARYFNNRIHIGYRCLKDFLSRGGILIPELVNYEWVWWLILSRKCVENIYYGGFVDFDNSPRKNKGNATIFQKATPKKFQKFLKVLYDKSVKESKEFLFLTAWNEWGEGAYLEPDNRYGYSYLQAVKNVVK